MSRITICTADPGPIPVGPPTPIDVERWTVTLGAPAATAFVVLKDGRELRFSEPRDLLFTNGRPEIRICVDGRTVFHGYEV